MDKDSFVFGANSSYPYFTRTVFNNGILGYVDYLDDDHLIKGNSLAVGMIGMQFFYMKHDFYAGQFTKTVFPKFEGFNELVALWFIAWLNRSSHTYQSVLVRDFEKTFNNTELIVPFVKGKVAVEHIEKRVRELEAERVRELEAYLQEAGFEDCFLTHEEESALKRINIISMKEVSIGELFDIKKGKRLTKADMIPGKINFIGATADKNGLTNKIANDSHIHTSNTITVTYNGSVGEAFYQFERFWASDDVNVLYAKDSLNENLALYYLAPIKKKGKGYAYSFKWTKEKMEKDSIWLPCKEGNNEIDYTFMETYISAIKKQCVARLKQEITKERSAYEQVLRGQARVVEISELKKEQPNLDNLDVWMAAEPFERYKWEGFDRSIRDFFGENQTILIGCYKGRKYQDWILSHNIYNIRLGKTKGSMEANRELFDNTSLLVLYEMGKPDKLSAYKIVEHREIGKEELIEMGYPNKKPRKSYMSFSLEPLDMNLTFLVEHHLIERIIELDADHAKGTPIFIEP
ncbi:MAG: restriction endonuclease subunit S [Eubacterium sp.]|nr:restriction endonuclease subunit S [Eubacterium sp.]